MSCGLIPVTAVGLQLLRLCVRAPQEYWKSVSCDCRVFSRREAFVGLITRPEETYRVCECGRVASINEEALAHWGLLEHGEKNLVYTRVQQ